MQASEKGSRVTSTAAHAWGEWLELSTGVDSLLDALATFEALGFESVPVTDFVPGPRAVVTDGRLSIGLYGPETEEPAATFVRPDLRTHVRALESAGLAFEFTQLGDDAFHTAWLREPGGLPLRLIEARSFPPVTRKAGVVPVCGEFAELSLAVDSLDEAAAFWTALGFRNLGEGREPHSWQRLTGGGLTVGLHETTRFRVGVTFVARQLEARMEYLRAKGFSPRARSPFTRDTAAACTLAVPGGLSFFLLEPGAEWFS